MPKAKGEREGKGGATAERGGASGTLPPRGNSPQYRIRSDEERRERVMTQDDLETVGILQSDSSLIERTFGNG